MNDEQAAMHYSAVEEAKVEEPNHIFDSGPYKV
jgi:hypothetical protein